jgi:hypothetical protein
MALKISRALTNAHTKKNSHSLSGELMALCVCYAKPDLARRTIRQILSSRCWIFPKLIVAWCKNFSAQSLVHLNNAHGVFA